MLWQAYHTHLRGAPHKGYLDSETNLDLAYLQPHDVKARVYK
jgi:hypothetical protein